MQFDATCLLGQLEYYARERRRLEGFRKAHPELDAFLGGIETGDWTSADAEIHKLSEQVRTEAGLSARVGLS